MRLGLVSDSHDNLTLVQTVARLFRDEGVDRVFHLGDVCLPDTLDPLTDFRLLVVAGNNDDASALGARARERGFEFQPDAWRGTLAGIPVGATHGHLSAVKRRLREHLDHGLLLHGHTHRAQDTVDQKLRVLNPGALYRARVRSACILDLPDGEARFFDIRDDGARRLPGLPGHR